ncbi:hypothetical protein KTT_34100 [Tengunoibacter tsumagoiensis]|uniref:Uncharacterized protein n=1 Tax=Tengunoibacter tsumagoiensis TaxID=2014871 RepID=A0A402A3I4_9CHLR|nr:hypothetical protein KTT_34100 [Tengunoibacter tsumagoiensis]
MDDVFLSMCEIDGRCQECKGKGAFEGNTWGEWLEYMSFSHHLQECNKEEWVTTAIINDGPDAFMQ